MPDEQLLAEGFSALENDAQNVGPEQILTRSSGGYTSDGGEILLGVDALRARHLLLPTTASFPSDTSSRGVTLTPRLVGKHGDQTFVDLTCASARLNLVFERLCSDVIQRVEELPDLSPAEVCGIVLDDWRELLRGAQSKVDRETIVGLAGELEILRILAEDGAGAALHSWKGPFGAIHDFVGSTGDLEVKTTTSVDAQTITVSNLDQLDAAGKRPLHLVAVHLFENPDGPSVDDRVRELMDLGVPRGPLLKCLDASGYVFESVPDSETLRFTSQNVMVWACDDKFPALRRSELPSGVVQAISRVRYDISLAALGDPVDSSTSFLESWAR